MEAGQVKGLLGPGDEALQIGLVDGTNGILAGTVSFFSNLRASQVDIRYPRSMRKLAAELPPQYKGVTYRTVVLGQVPA